uniref:Uncharacterized protein n=1 Tax=Setaria viridis TaxID=4556 RepID=A0A4U6VJQ9_SETVI|nr:hypothetical protein SEVIR_3G378901v2 [Setaria viridis]
MVERIDVLLPPLAYSMVDGFCASCCYLNG